MLETTRRRLEAIKAVSVKYTPLTPERVGSAIRFGQDQLRQLYCGGGEPPRHVQRMDISNCEPEDVRRMFFDLPIRDDWVELVWPFERAGVRMRYWDFVRIYDDLWYPSRDDLLVTNQSCDWLLELNHEETVTYFGGQAADLE